MGFFSWLTGDTNESVPVSHSDHPDHPHRPVYLLQPNGAPTICEPSYEGFGIFGGVNAYEWIGRHNLPPHLLLPAENGEPDPAPVMASNGFMTRVLKPGQITSIGITLDVGDYLEDPENGRKMAIFHSGPELIDPTIVHLGITWDQPVPGYAGMGANDLVASGRLVRRSFEMAVPLKLSFDPEARYEDVGPSANCPDQGFFYPSEEDEICGSCGEPDCDNDCDGDYDEIGDGDDAPSSPTVH